jgi:putative phage-type endonuclease
MSYTVIESTGQGLNWLRGRKNMLTASEGAVVVNLSPWQTPYDLWRDKMSEEISERDIDLFYFAHALEKPIADRVEQKWPDEFGMRTMPSPGLIQWDEHPHIGATPDFLTLTDDEGPVPLQVKTVSDYAREKWGDFKSQFDVPDQYRIQVIIENAVLGKPYGYLLPLVGNHTLHKPIRIDTDREFLDWYVKESGEWFQRHIVEQTPPPVTVGDDLVEMWPGNPGQQATATPEIVAAHRARKIYMLERTIRETADEHLKVDIATHMGDATELFDPKTGELIVTWRPKKSPAVFDLPRLRADHPDLVDEYSTPGKPQRSMLFKDTKRTKADKAALLGKTDDMADLGELVADTLKGLKNDQ